MLTEKSRDQELIDALRNEAGVDPADGASREELCALCKENGIKVGSTRKAPAKTEKPTAYVINITGDKNKREVIVGVNGVISQIKCDVDVEVKAEILECLRNAKRRIYEDVRNELGQLVDRTSRQVPVHAVSIKREVFR